MGRPGWPLLDLLTASTASILMLLMQSVSREAGAATIFLIGDVVILTDGVPYFSWLNTRHTLCPPKPKELESTTPNFSCLAVLGT